ncbi:MAG: methylenetetrahydrofolate reductase [Syntrophobacteraceae bacterium]
MTSNSRLERIFRAGHLAVTSECGPPRGCNGEAIEEKAKLIGNHVDAINVTDNQTAVVRMCSLASCIKIKQLGYEPVFQMVARDRNRIAAQSDILGAASFGISTMLCLTGDHQSFGDHPTAANVFDLDSTQMLMMVTKMREEGKLLSDYQMKHPPKMFVGAAENPFADPFEIRVPRLAKKIAAGAQFIQTQCIYNVPKFKEWMKGVVERGLHEKCFIMAGVTPMKSVGMARYMKSKVPGMDVPDELIKRMNDVPKEKQPEEGIKILIEQIEEIKQIKGVAGFHIMAIEWEEKVPEIVERAGLYPRPEVS